MRLEGARFDRENYSGMMMITGSSIVFRSLRNRWARLLPARGLSDFKVNCGTPILANLYS